MDNHLFRIISGEQTSNRNREDSDKIAEHTSSKRHGSASGRAQAKTTLTLRPNVAPRHCSPIERHRYIRINIRPSPAHHVRSPEETTGYEGNNNPPQFITHIVEHRAIDRKPMTRQQTRANTRSSSNKATDTTINTDESRPKRHEAARRQTSTATLGTAGPEARISTSPTPGDRDDSSRNRGPGRTRSKRRSDGPRDKGHQHAPRDQQHTAQAPKRGRRPQMESTH